MSTKAETERFLDFVRSNHRQLGFVNVENFQGGQLITRQHMDLNVSRFFRKHNNLATQIANQVVDVPDWTQQITRTAMSNVDIYLHTDTLRHPVLYHIRPVAGIYEGYARHLTPQYAIDLVRTDFPDVASGGNRVGSYHYRFDDGNVYEFGFEILDSSNQSEQCLHATHLNFKLHQALLNGYKKHKNFYF